MTNAEDQGMLFVLNDVEPEHEDEFNRWYDTEHMQERMSVPGFLSVRRYRVAGGGLRYCTLYNTESLAVFGSDAYRQKLASQTEWSKRILKVFVEPNRLVGRIRKKLGEGFAGHLAVLKSPKSQGNGAGAAAANTIASDIAALPGIAAVRVFEAEPALSGPVKEYRPVLRPLVQPDDILLLVEASTAAAIEPARLEAISASGKATHLGSYSFAWGLAAAPI